MPHGSVYPSPVPSTMATPPRRPANGVSRETLLSARRNAVREWRWSTGYSSPVYHRPGGVSLTGDGVSSVF
jgi:hypothetical protein